MKPDSPLWKVMGDPASPAEATALDAFRALLPDDGITTAWANLTFINDQGRTAEVDVLLLTTQGMYLSLIHISEPTRLIIRSRMPSSA